MAQRDPELQKAHQAELQRIALHQQMNQITYTCFKKCLKSPEVVRLSSGEEMCFEHCTARQLEAQQMVAQRVSQGEYIHL